MKAGWILLLLVAVMGTSAQNLKVHDFVIDQSKPYVYLKVDHVGPRRPLDASESKTGLWLKVVNNCRIPILFRSFAMPDDIPGVAILDEVVANDALFEITSSLEEVKENEIKDKARRRKLEHIPKGYAYMREVSGVLRVQPGTEALFSVPLNHVDKDWHMQIKFELATSESSIGDGPYTYLDFYDWDIPKEMRPVNLK